MNLDLFKDILSIDSTTGKERELALWLHEHLEAPSKQLMEVGDGTLNLLLCWGTPEVVFCTHMDTVPPYLPVRFEEGAAPGMTPLNEVSTVWGRGACDAKGQIIAMYTACKELDASGASGFGLLLLAGEETCSWGAKAFAKTGFKAPFLIVGEPTENKMVSASKGTKSYDLRFQGKAFHSGYPEYGVSAVELFNEFCNKLSAMDFGEDTILGKTTWNIGLLHSDNPQNILSPELTCRIYFRTTFVSDEKVEAFMQGITGTSTVVTARGGDKPARYVVLPGFESGPVAFGSDAPHLGNFGHKIICGPGSIRFAHRDDEHIDLPDVEKAIGLYKSMYAALHQAPNPATQLPD